MRVLIAEDDQHIALILQICLERFGGHEVVLAHDGDAALTRALGGQFDLLLLDGSMPKRSGLQVASEFKALGHTTPVIFLSAKTDPSEIAEFLAHGVGYIPKPFEPQSVCTKIDEILKGAETRTG